MKKHYYIFHTTGTRHNLREPTLKRTNEFETELTAETYIFEHPEEFSEETPYTILPVYYKPKE